MLFGQGPLVAGAGAIGGGVGSLVGGQMGGYAGGLAATSAVTALQNFSVEILKKFFFLKFNKSKFRLKSL